MTKLGSHQKENLETFGKLYFTNLVKKCNGTGIIVTRENRDDNYVLSIENIFHKMITTQPFRFYHRYNEN